MSRSPKDAAKDRRRANAERFADAVAAYAVLDVMTDLAARAHMSLIMAGLPAEHPAIVKARDLIDGVRVSHEHAKQLLNTLRRTL